MHHRHRFILTSILFFCLFCGNCAFALFNSDLLALQSEIAALRYGTSTEEPSNSQHKIALLIGNSAYEDSYALDDSEDNITAMARLLAAKGFEVDSHLNLDSYAMRHVLEGFERKLQADSFVVFFFSGYAFEKEGMNYLASTDFTVRDTMFASIGLDTIVNSFSYSQTQLIFIENFDYPTSFRGSTNWTMADIPTDDWEDASNILISVANMPHSMPCCTGQQNLYVPALLRYLNDGALEIEDALKSVREEILSQSGGLQRPWAVNHLTEPVYLMEQSE